MNLFQIHLKFTWPTLWRKHHLFLLLDFYGYYGFFLWKLHWKLKWLKFSKVPKWTPKIGTHNVLHLSSIILLQNKVYLNVIPLFWNSFKNHFNKLNFILIWKQFDSPNCLWMFLGSQLPKWNFILKVLGMPPLVSNKPPTSCEGMLPSFYVITLLLAPFLVASRPWL